MCEFAKIILGCGIVNAEENHILNFAQIDAVSLAGAREEVARVGRNA